MKVRVLYASAFQHLDPDYDGADTWNLSTDQAQNAIAAGYAEAMTAKVERATKVPGEKRSVDRPTKEDE